MHRFNLVRSSLVRSSDGSGTNPLRHLSYSLFPTSFWIRSMVSLSPLVMAWPRNDSTLKLLVLVGKIMKATTVTSEPEAFNMWFNLANDSMKMSAPLLVNSYLPAVNKYRVRSRLKSRWPWKCPRTNPSLCRRRTSSGTHANLAPSVLWFFV